jgi:hypothetical protein
VAIVDPSVEYTINTLSNLILQGTGSGSPMWGDLIQSGIGNGTRFVRNIFGFDIYVSNYLPAAGAGGVGGAETINSRTIAAGVVNTFMSLASPDLIPYVGAWGQMPKVDSEFKKDYQRTEYVTTARWGLKVYRPENLIGILSSTSVIV